MHTSISSNAIREICNVLVNAQYNLGAPGGPIQEVWRDDPHNSFDTSSCQRSFAALVTAFLNSLAADSRTDLGREWLLHRLHGILVEHQHPRPGEIEVIRADVRARAGLLRLSEHDAALLVDGVDKILHGIGQLH